MPRLPERGTGFQPVIPAFRRFLHAKDSADILPPFGWAPLEMIAVEGLRGYGYQADANRISREFLSLVADQYRTTGEIVEKYDVVRRSLQVSSEIRFG